MSTMESDVAVRDSSRSAVVSQLVTRNPFYLLSGVCLFAGCFLVSTALREERDQLGPVLALFGVVTLYEWLVLGLGLLLVARRGLTRDGGYLLLLAVLLLADGTFVYNELATMSAGVGGAVNASAVVLGLVKVALIAHVLGVRLVTPQWAVLALNLAVLMALPLVFRTLAQAEALTTPVLHGIWWSAGVWLALQALGWRGGIGGRAGLTTLDGLRCLMHRAIVFVPAVSVLVHLGAGHFVYDVPFHVAHLSPVLLGLATCVAVVMRPREPACRFVFVLGLAALMAALTAPGALMVTELRPGEWTLSPLRAALIVVALMWMWMAWRHRTHVLWLPAVLSVGLAVTGATPGEMADRLSRWGTWLRETPGAWLPTSMLQWGMLVLGLAFVLLVAGCVVSLRKPAQVAFKPELGGDEPAD